MPMYLIIGSVFVQGCIYRGYLTRGTVHRSQTSMDCFLGPAQLALDLTAPVEGTRAPFHHHDLLSPVAAAAAHQVTPVHADAGVVALATVRSLDAELWVPLTEHG